jgi:hypothetical protein
VSVADPITYTGAEGAPSIAVDVQATGVLGEFSVDVDEVGGPALLGWGETGWLNIVCDVTRLVLRRGATRRQGVLARAEAASITLEILDTDRRFDPLLNADAVHAGTPLRVRAWQAPSAEHPEGWSEVLVTGEVDDVPVTYTRTGAPRVTLEATDVIGAELVPWASPGYPEPGVGAGDNLVERVERVLDELNVAAGLSPETALATEFSATHPATTLERGWQAIADAADAELGRVWITRHGEIAVRGRTLEPRGTLRGTLSDWHGEAPVEPHVCYGDLAAALGTELLVNRTIGQRRLAAGDESTPALVQRDDVFSQALYRTRVGDGENRSLELETDAQVVDWCEQLLAVSSVPELRVDAVNPAPWGAGTEAWRAVCATDIGDRWLLRHHPEIGPSIAVAVGVLGIELEVTPEGWSIRWATESALAPGDNPSSSFAVDVSELSGEDELATFGGPVPAPEAVA